MLEEYEKKRRKQLSSMRAMMDFAMGVLIVSAGVFFFFRNRFKIEFNENFPPNYIDKIFGAICLLYGAWRIYRGFKKNYFK
jgi:threonine/homoserine/homoserine lactone efflux protein